MSSPALERVRYAVGQIDKVAKDARQHIQCVWEDGVRECKDLLFTLQSANIWRRRAASSGRAAGQPWAAGGGVQHQ